MNKILIKLLGLFVFILGFGTSELRGQANFYIFEDTTRQLSVQKIYEIWKSQKFKKTPERGNNIGITQSVFWLAVDVNQLPASKDSSLLYIGDTHINTIDCYILSDTIRWIGSTGDHYPFKHRYLPLRSFYFPIRQASVYLLRIDKAKESLQLFYYLTDLDAAYQADNSVIIMFFSGIMVACVFFGLLLWSFTGEKVYFLYSMYLVFAWLYVLAHTGFGFQYIWPNDELFANKARPVFGVISLGIGFVYMVYFVGEEQNKYWKFFLKMVYVTFILFLPVALSINPVQDTTTPYFYYVGVLDATILALIIFALILLIRSAILGNKFTRFYLMVTILLYVSVSLHSITQLLNLGNSNMFLHQYGMALGYILEALALFGAQVYQFNRYRVEKLQLKYELSNNRVELSKSLIQVQQTERKRIADQLHDVAGSFLTAAKMNISVLKNKAEASSIYSYLDKIEDAIIHVSSILRNLSHALSPVMIEQIGFRAAIEKIIAIANAAKLIQIECILIGIDEEDSRKSKYFIHIYSIVYELLNNIIKHSGAKNALIQIIKDENEFRIYVEDNGRGMEVENTDFKSYGLSGVVSKVKYLGGEIVFDSNRMQGLIINIEIPIDDEENKDIIGR